MIASRTSWRLAWLAAAVAAGLALAFVRGAQPAVLTPDVALPRDVERIDDGSRHATPRIQYDGRRGILEDTPVVQPRHDRGF